VPFALNTFTVTIELRFVQRIKNSNCFKRRDQLQRNGFTAVIREDGPWWIGWIEEIAGVNSQGVTREELLANLREALAEAIEMNREDAKSAAGSVYEEVAILP